TLHKGGGFTVRLGDLEKLSGTLTVAGVTTELEGTALSGEIQKEGDQLTFTDLGIGTLKVSKLAFTDAAKGLTMDKTATLTGLKLDKLVLVREDAPLEKDAKPGTKPEKRIKSLNITSLIIPSIEAPELSYWQYTPAKPNPEKPAEKLPAERLEVA